jgi:hypothetical protein
MGAIRIAAVVIAYRIGLSLSDVVVSIAAHRARTNRVRCCRKTTQKDLGATPGVRREMKKIVENLPFNAAEEELRGLFEQTGTILDHHG